MTTFNSIKPAHVSDRAKTIVRFTSMVVGYAVVITAASILVKVATKTLSSGE